MYEQRLHTTHFNAQRMYVEINAALKLTQQDFNKY